MKPDRFSINKLSSILWAEFLHGAHLISLGALGIVLTIIILFNLTIDVTPLIIAYLIFQIIYTYNYFREIKFDITTNPERVSHINDRRLWIKVAPFVYLFLLLILLITSNTSLMILSCFMVIGGILYTEYFKRLPILGFKNYYTSFFWALSVFIVPFYYSINVLPFIYIVIFIFIRGLVNTIFFDIKDIVSDGERGLKTFPVFLGKKRTLNTLHILNLLSCIPILIGVFNNSLPTIALGLCLTILNGIYYLSKAKEVEDKKLRILSSILVDGEYMLWPLVILIIKLLF
jgi:4-hydroxybenzoate polyprenyltransferase